MAIWVTSDSHFGHKGVLRLVNRPFADVREMDEAMIVRWNAVVAPDDIVYHLGDFTLAGPRIAAEYAARLRGRLYLVPGSHDRRWTKGRVGYLPIHTMYQAPVLVGEPMMTIRPDGKNLFVLCHYAMRVWPKSCYGSFHLYGHSHGRLPGLGRSMDVGVDCHDFRPLRLDAVLVKLDVGSNNGI